MTFCRDLAKRAPRFPILPTCRRPFITLVRSKSTLSLVLSSAQHSLTHTPVTPLPTDLQPHTVLISRRVIFPTTRTTIQSAAYNRIDG
ncbi:uncharacterized protein L3040_002505 [Drepanopeziza brunnea f. sp. 'multigermtubi']|uniref:uncharacterized protein n=1 Tax=Drepanopeziza brunnea f. sp. 'multigermtubi' TaxID=698441 RepID=UPI0023A3D6B9|nr:hypothetical protein L3040_002505 [Drepanopeziza brunnea f. sp. 'multigermtubi']